MTYTLGKRKKLKLAARIKRNLRISGLPNKFNNRIAFTLAEMLIVLTITGIVAALAIPPVAQKIQDAQFRVVAKEIYSSLEQATIKIITSKGGNIDESDLNTHTDFMNLYRPYLNYIRYCNDTEGIAKGCWHSGPPSIHFLNGTIANIYIGSHPGIVLNNGALLLFNGADCTFECGVIDFDVNGLKGPNVIGRDLFQITLHENHIHPRGSIDQCSRSDTGEGCLIKILRGLDY